MSTGIWLPNRSWKLLLEMLEAGCTLQEFRKGGGDVYVGRLYSFEHDHTFDFCGRDADDAIVEVWRAWKAFPK